MTDEQIEAIIGAMNYAALYLDRTTKLGPGCDRWSRQLARLTLAQRQVLESKLARQAARLQSEVPSASNYAKVPLQKRANLGIR